MAAKKGNNNAQRAGKRRCRRCKEVWNRKKGDFNNVCLRCQTHCIRCDCELTDETRSVAYAKQGYYICKACCVERVMLYYRKPGQKEINRDRVLVRTYGITAVEYDEVLKNQGGVCYICQYVPKEGGRKLAVDHLHSRGEKKRNPREKRARVRGLLCWQCNSAIGKFRDDITRLRRAADYLECWPAQKVLNKEGADE